MKTGRMGALAAGAAVMMMGFLPLGAQEAKPSPKAEEAGRPAAKRPADASRRVPPFFGQLGLSGGQREEIYKIRGKYQEKIDALTKQIDDLQAEMLAECESVLDAGQKQVLEARRKVQKPSPKKSQEPARAAKEPAKATQ